jgi:chemotaxis family two-component system response regulator Rcp1
MRGQVCHIVIVEDNEPDLVMIQFSLREAGVGCDVTSFSDGAEALRHVNDPSSRVPDLMILDFSIPKVEGTVILNNVRGNPRWAEVGVFMFTASQDPGDMWRVKQLRADECLRKPMDLAGFAEIGRKAAEWLEQHGNRADGSGRR